MQAIVLAICVGTQAGGREPATRLVTIHATRVHLRSGIPVQLDHGNVIRHLSRGETFSVDRISYGITAAGDGMDGIWVHATSIRNPKVAGWICARYIAEVATDTTSERAEQSKEEAKVDSKSVPSTPAIVIIPPLPTDHLLSATNSILGIVNSLISMILMIGPMLGVQWLLGRFTHGPPATANTAPIQYVIRTSPQIGGEGSPNNFYGKNWWISIKR